MQNGSNLIKRRCWQLQIKILKVVTLHKCMLPHRRHNQAQVQEWIMTEQQWNQGLTVKVWRSSLSQTLEQWEKNWRSNLSPVIERTSLGPLPCRRRNMEFSGTVWVSETLRTLIIWWSTFCLQRGENCCIQNLPWLDEQIIGILQNRMLSKNVNPLHIKDNSCSISMSNQFKPHWQDNIIHSALVLNPAPTTFNLLQCW